MSFAKFETGLGFVFAWFSIETYCFAIFFICYFPDFLFFR